MLFRSPPDAKNQLTGKDPDARKDWRQEEKGMTEDEMVGWHHRLNGHEFEQALRDGEGQGSLVCCSPWGHKESNTTEQLTQRHTYSAHHRGNAKQTRGSEDQRVSGGSRLISHRGCEAQGLGHLVTPGLCGS